MYLVDTNVWLERLLDQVRSEEVGKFLDYTPSNHLFITDFSFHSIGLILSEYPAALLRLGTTDWKSNNRRGAMRYPTALLWGASL